MEFCSDCNNMLHPTEDRARRKLVYACRNCETTIDAPTHRVYQHHLVHKADEYNKTIFYNDLVSDPTLPRTTGADLCVKCKNDEAIFFQSRVRNPEETFTIFFVCTRCKHKWTSS